MPHPGGFGSIFDSSYKYGWHDQHVLAAQERTLDPSAMAIETFVVVCVLTLFGGVLYSFVSKNAEGLKMMWKYRDHDGLGIHAHGARWSWWLYKTPKQRADLARRIEETRQRNGYYEKHAKNGGPPGAWDYATRFVICFLFFSWMLWAFAEWVWPLDDEDGMDVEDGCDEGCVFKVAGLGLCVWMGACGCEHLAVYALGHINGFVPEFILAWLVMILGWVGLSTPMLVSIYGAKCVWTAAFGDYALSGPDIMVLLTCLLGACCYYVNRDGFSEEEQRFLGHARSATPGAWYDQGHGRTPLNEQLEEVTSALEEQAASAPFKLTKAQRKAIGREREVQREAERQAQTRKARQDAKEQKARARAIQAAALKKLTAEFKPPKPGPDEEWPPGVTTKQAMEASITRAVANAEIARRRLKKAEQEKAKCMDLLDQAEAEAWEQYEQGLLRAGEGSGEGFSHADHVDSADLAHQTQLNKEEAERKRRVREQREKEKAEQKEKEYSEAGPSHKEGAPKWVDAPPDDADKAKLQAERQASLLRKQEQQKERVKEKEAQEKRESERLQSLKTGKRILQGNVQNRACNNNVQRSSLQPLREDEPAPTLTLADVALRFQEDPRFQERDDDLESVATTAVPAMLTNHAEERSSERKYTAYQIKHTLKYGRAEEGNLPGTYVHYPCHECHPKLVTDAEGTVITVI